MELIIQPNPTNGVDSYVTDASPDANNGTETFLEIGFRPVNSKKYRGYLKFDVTPIAPGSIINSAIIHIYMYNTDENVASNTTWGCNKVTGSWDEATLTWNNQPSFEGTAEDTVNFNGNTTGWRELDITALVQDWVNGIVTNNGVVVKQDNEGAAVLAAEVYSSDYVGDTSLRPKLVINYNYVSPFPAHRRIP